MTPWAAGPPALALLLVGAGAAKLLRPRETALALVRAVWSHEASAPGRVAKTTVRVGAAAELLIGVADLARGGRILSLLVSLSYLAFGVFVTWALIGRRPLASCGCFGEPDTPPTAAHVAFCAVACLVAGLNSWHGPAWSLPMLIGRIGPLAPALLLLVLGIGYCGYLILGPGARLTQIRSGAKIG